MRNETARVKARTLDFIDYRYLYVICEASYLMEDNLGMAHNNMAGTFNEWNFFAGSNSTRSRAP